MKKLTKVCCSCGSNKETNLFYADASKIDCLSSRCRDCTKSSSAKWRNENRIAHREYSKKWSEENKAESNNRSRTWTLNNKEQHASNGAKWRAKNSSSILARNQKRRAVSKNATPKWSEKFFIEEAYSLAALRTRIFGFAWHVDHIVPLQSKIVCGLNAYTNIQVIPAFENIAKSNRIWPNMPIGV